MGRVPPGLSRPRGGAGKHWIRVLAMTTALWPGLVSAVTLLNNAVALYYESSRAIHFGTLVRHAWAHSRRACARRASNQCLSGDAWRA